MQDDKERKLAQWGGPDALAHWRAAGVTPDVAAYGALLLGRLRNPAYSFSMKGELDTGFHRHFIDQVVQARSFEDFSAIFKAQLDLVEKMEISTEVEQEIYSKNLGPYLPDAGMPVMEEEPSLRLDATRIRSWEEAQYFMARSFPPSPHQPTAEIITPQALCERYGLSSIMVPIHIAHPQGMLERLDRSLNAVCHRIGLQDTAQLGGYGRLSISFSKTSATLASGSCSTFDRLQEGFIELHARYDEHMLHHECMHWLDAMARWGVSPDETGKARSDCLSSLDENCFPDPHPARQIKQALARFAQAHPAYIEEAHKADIDLHLHKNRMARVTGLPEKQFEHYYLAAQEILARAFEYGESKKFSRNFEREAIKRDPGIGADIDRLAHACIEILRPHAVKWAAENQLPWTASVKWAGQTPSPIEAPFLKSAASERKAMPDEADDFLLRSFSRLPSIAKTGIDRLKTVFRF